MGLRALRSQETIIRTELNRAIAQIAAPAFSSCRGDEIARDPENLALVSKRVSRSREYKRRNRTRRNDRFL